MCRRHHTWRAAIQLNLRRSVFRVVAGAIFEPCSEQLPPTIRREQWTRRTGSPRSACSHASPWACCSLLRRTAARQSIERAKITAVHLSRQAIVYLRQSSPAQVQYRSGKENRQKTSMRSPERPANSAGPRIAFSSWIGIFGLPGADASHVIGRGITNSRSNYATAARVASEEAHVDGRFTLFRQGAQRGRRPERRTRQVPRRA